MLLSVGILTYNQEQYIRQCLDSVLMQEVDFEYEIVVGDDCSSDTTLDILQEYVSRLMIEDWRLKNAPHCVEIRVIKSEKNEGIAMNYKKMLSACKGKYIALCEGDDYWTDVHKLQEQADFLEKHPDYGFVGTYNTMLFPDGTAKDDQYDYLPEPHQEGKWELYGDLFEYAKCGPVTRTVSLCFRRELIQPYLQYVGMGNDMVLQAILAKQSKFAKHSATMCVYRQGGVSSSNSGVGKQLYYNNWYVQNRLLQKKLFPDGCNWDENELADSETYILLKDAIKHKRAGEAMRLKSKLKSNAYKCKKYSRYLKGPVTCLLLSFKLR